MPSGSTEQLYAIRQTRCRPRPMGCFTLQWRHNGRDSVSNHHLHDCLLNRLFRRRSKKTLKLRVTGLCAGNSPGTGEFPAQTASNAENVSIWWRHHEYITWTNNEPAYCHHIASLSQSELTIDIDGRGRDDLIFQNWHIQSCMLHFHEILRHVCYIESQVIPKFVFKWIGSFFLQPKMIRVLFW